MQLSSSTTITGRVVVDAFEIIKKDPWVKFKRYDLDTVAKAMIGVGKTELKGKNFLEKMREAWNSNIQELVDYAKMDSVLVMRIIIEKRLLDKFFEIAKVSGILKAGLPRRQSQRHSSDCSCVSNRNT
jgi:DNA polymerase I